MLKFGKQSFLKQKWKKFLKSSSLFVRIFFFKYFNFNIDFFCFKITGKVNVISLFIFIMLSMILSFFLKIKIITFK